MIIDAHAHLGCDVVFDEASTAEELLSWGARFGVTASIVQPFVPRPYIEDTRGVHDEIAALAKSPPGRFYGMASIDPHLRPEEYEAEAARCVKTLGFVGMKITPIAHAVNPGSKDGRHAFETARALDVPMMVHTGSGAPFADPAQLFQVARDFRDMRIVLAHAGTDLLFAQALWLAKENDNVWLEPSWLSILNVRRALNALGPEKLMFSSDHAVNIPVELAKYQTLLEGDALDRVLSGTAIEVFRLPITKKEATAR